MRLLGLQVFTWPIDWSNQVNGSWSFDMREFLLGFGPELTDVKQDHVVHGFEFNVDFAGDDVDAIQEFMDELEGRAHPFWLPGPMAAFSIQSATGNTLVVREQGAAESWQLHPGGYLWFAKHGEQGQAAKVVSVVDNGDGTETVTFEQVQESHVSSSSSGNSSSSTAASETSSSSSGHSSSSSVNSSSSSSSSSSSENSSSSGHSSSSSGGESSSSNGESSSSSSSAFVAVDETWQVFPLMIVRSADDTEGVELLAERLVRRKFKVVELPHEYARLESDGAVDEPSKAVFLYRFTCEVDGGTLEWRYTSYPTDVTTEATAGQSSSSSEGGPSSSSSTGQDSSASSASTSSSSSSAHESTSSYSSSSSSRSSGEESASSSSSQSGDSSSSSSSTQSSSSSSSSQSSSSTEASVSSSSSSSSGDASRTWTAVGIEHGRISRSTKLGGTVTIVGDYDAVEPLRLLLPARLTAPMRVQILKTDEGLSETTIMFEGAVRKPELDGKRIRASCVEWGEVMESRLLNFFIQPTCNYNVFDSATCRADPTAHELAVTVVASAGRTVVVDGAGMAGKAAHYFALGRLWAGTGESREVMFVADSSEADGNRVVLKLSRSMSATAPFSATVRRGCDGLRTTCSGVFDNIVNFGGHETPRDNLTLAAIRNTAGAGGKK